MEEKLKEYGLKIYWNEDGNREEPLDFSINDGEDNVAWVWGAHPVNDVNWECNHPYECVEFGDKDEQCECRLCGAFGDWHYVEDDKGNKVPEPHEWYPRRDVGGLIGEYIKELQEKW